MVLYDNVAGSGRPLWVTWTESDGINTNFTSAYEAEVENAPAVSGAWGAYIPNALANGVRRVEYRDFDNNLVGFVSDTDGLWTDGSTSVNTVNPSGGTAAPLRLGTLAAIVPEPGATGLVFAGVAMVSGWRRFRRAG